MCLLTFYPAGTAPDTDALAVGAQVNDDGHGFAVVTGSEIVVGHGLRAAEVIGEFAEVRARFPDGPALFHSRYATHGVVDVGNCHPFWLGRDRRTVVAHNGVLPKRVRPGPYDRRSDTRIAAEQYLPRQPFGSPDTRQGRRGLESWLGTSKLVLLTVNPAYREHAYVFNEHAGIWDEEIWYSNTSYLRDRLRPGLWLYTCGYCRTVDASRRGRYCGRCGWCFVCLTPYPDCDCATFARGATVTALPRRSHRPHGSARSGVRRHHR
ncbi:hypothetical protein [Nocardia mexicana]|uniref:Glutamine amidotransferase n=1 Tax=Nocardia mexicana TaxID=279262 RepID=A0A370GNJ1_9NOCA|nr:hypothetical protein [Nocardia mexicana]RDI45302.1 glutamine amidotransferase [Nocardia mexicana]